MSFFQFFPLQNNLFGKIIKVTMKYVENLIIP